LLIIVERKEEGDDLSVVAAKMTPPSQFHTLSATWSPLSFRPTGTRARREISHAFQFDISLLRQVMIFTACT
jgi:hypothetical protein